MKKILSIVLVATLLFSCNSNDTASPKGAVSAFIESMKKGDVESMKKLITKSDKSMLDMAESMAKAFGGEKNIMDSMKKEFVEKSKDVSYTIKDEKIEGDKGTVFVEIKEKDKLTTQEFKTVKEDGLWKVSLMSTGMNMAGEDGKKLGDMNIGDSVNKYLDKVKDIKLDSVDVKAKEFLKKIEDNKDALKEAAKKFEEEMKKNK